MDLKESGKLIAELRKEKRLTQVKLAEMLHVSEKTISKWECGNGFPDASLMLPLCEALDITANELLSGKRLNNDEYKSHAERNLAELKSKQEKSAKFMLTLEVVFGFLSSLAFMIMVFVASYSHMSTAARLILIIFGCVQFFIAIVFCLWIEKDAGFYECSNCHHRYIPTFKQVFFSTHFGRTRYMRCPKCNKKSWCKKVYKT